VAIVTTEHARLARHHPGHDGSRRLGSGGLGRILPLTLPPWHCIFGEPRPTSDRLVTGQDVQVRMSSIWHLWSHFGSSPRQEAVFAFLILRPSLGTAWRKRSIVTSRCAVRTVHLRLHHLLQLELVDHGDERCGSRLLGPVDIVALSRKKRWWQAEAVTAGTGSTFWPSAPSPHAARLRKAVDPRRVR
jgi:hypothetical protein